MDNSKYKTGLKRLCASLIDFIVFIPFYLVKQFAFSYTGNSIVIFLLTSFVIFLPLFYSVYCHTKFGQTIGKWVVGVKILDIGEINQITIYQAFLRDSIYFTIETIGLGYTLFMTVQTDKHNYVIDAYEDFTKQPIYLWTILELISMLTNKKRRSINDFIANTVVVRL